VAVFREFCRFDFGRERALDSTTLLNFRHLLEEWGRPLMGEVRPA
jgi:IS5 family transposase